MDISGTDGWKPCTGFFSMYGCPNGEKCEFLHHDPRTGGGPSHAQNRRLKTIVCQTYKSKEGCRFGERCPFAHHGIQAISGPASSFGASTTAKISFDASLASLVIGREGVTSKKICSQTGAKLFVRYVATDPSLCYLELEGTLDQVEEAIAMVKEVIKSSRTFNYKTRLCQWFITEGCCPYGEKCHFAHGMAELPTYNTPNRSTI